MSTDYHIIRIDDLFSFNDTVYKKISTQQALNLSNGKEMDVFDIDDWSGLVTPVTKGGKKRSKRTRNVPANKYKRQPVIYEFLSFHLVRLIRRHFVCVSWYLCLLYHNFLGTVDSAVVWIR